MYEMHNKIAFITGGGSGIGEATAKTLAKNGATVVVADINDENAKKVVDEIEADGGKAKAIHLNVVDEQGWIEAMNEVEQLFGGLHILFNNAGIGGKGFGIDNEEMENWNNVIAVDQTGVMLGLKHGGALIEKSGGGSIINSSSIFGVTGGFGKSVAYHAAKGAVWSLSKNVALLWAKRGIRVNSIHPGFINTPILDGSDKGHLADITPMGRLGTAQEVANVVAFLSSDQSSFITGADIKVDGGYTAA